MNRNSLIVSEVSKIAVLRANALGDFIFVLPALQALRETYPRAEIVFLGKEWHKTFVPGRVGTIDRVVTVPAYPGVGSDESYQPDQKELDVFFQQMQAENFDIALQMHGGGGNSNPFLLKLGATLTAGTQAKGAAALDRNVPYVFYHNEVLRYLEVVAQVGANTAHISPVISVQDTDKKEISPLIEEHASTSKQYAVIHPGATDSRRHWPNKNFAAVATKLIDDGMTVFITGTGNEAAVVNEVIKYEPRAVSLLDKISLGGLSALLQDSAIVISNDTGPLHLAGAVGVKSVGIYWVGNLITAGHITRKNHRPLVSWTTHCPVCGAPCVDGYQTNKRYCEHKDSFVSDVTVERVLEEVRNLL